ncbi:daunorubicin resistance protein DrrA family ABC transporter ATP-binding protein [Sphaerisporangium rufum]|uniref:Daunorubicin resistance protein DrrA family ABC transporter ATP-binding protein n=1 Tax=Sphaerisporangium rufum TaxID=1381558 RepID=A0A919RBP3_9ACTN|nr:ATP-binding cassette domain-containing protein [Sphaerisporangium rufum]GII81005.1 daunorubicin resistance protein DrrA family ABC transporter ATP-binding protein [Sphaerisporangium rufum]
MTSAILAEGLVKTYGSVQALSGFDLELPVGGVLALLGPNGAGKSTAVRVLTTLLRPDAGRATIMGVDVLRDAGAVRKIIGVTGQRTSVDDHLTGRENLEMVGRLCRLSRRAARARAGELVERFGLGGFAGRPARTYSGGQRRRLDLAACLLSRPPVVFLDEPTTGLDPRSRFALWETVAELAREGHSVLLTTQYLEEADNLADTITMVDHGRVVAEGTPDELKARAGGSCLEVVVASADMLDKTERIIEHAARTRPEVDTRALRVSAPVPDQAELLSEVVHALAAAGVRLVDFSVRRRTLDEVFLALTGEPQTGGAR